MRLPGYDYYISGYYYVTLCTQNRQCLFGKIKNGDMILNDIGQMVHDVWANLPERHSGFENDSFVIMPNHVHGILIKRIENGLTPAVSLPEIIRNFKSFTTTCYMQGVKENRFEPFNKKIWQRNYYEHIIRSNDRLEKIRQYICENPTKWDEDRENPIHL
jgi:putative transposase